MIKPILFCFLYALFNVSGAALIKWKLKGRVLNEFRDWIGFLFEIQVILAFVVIFVSALVFFKALSFGGFSFIVPVATGINFALTIVAGYFIFKDNLNMISLLGFSLIISGIIVLSLNNSTQHAQ